jgi:prolyl-tRNA synthetase
VFQTAEELASAAEEAGLRVLLDDRRQVSPGVKFNDSELLGVPTIVVVGKRLVDGAVEIKDRATGEREEVALTEALGRLVEICRG